MMKITSGPNLQGYCVIALLLWLCYDLQSVLPLLWFVGVLAVLIPLCIWLHRWNERQNLKMVEDFPFDLEIQQKYGKKNQN